MENNHLQFCRLRSVRSRKRIIKKDVEKQIRKKYKRSKELWKQRRDIPLVPLEKPYQKGFVRFFVVRDDVMRTKDGIFFEGILNKINSYMYSDSRKFLKKKRKFGRRIYVEREQKINRITEFRWNDPKLGLTQREKQYFMKQESYDPVYKTYKIYYEFIEPWRFVLRIRPNMITHYKPLDLELEKEYAALESYLQQHKIQGFICKKIYGKSRSWFMEEKDFGLIGSRKYFNCTMSATEIADSLQDL